MAFKRDTRSRTLDRLEFRESPAGSPPAPVVVVGYAAVFDAETTLYEDRDFRLREVIRPGAFANALAAGQDVRALYNHDPNYLLGRTRSGTLALAEDAVGLRFELTMPATNFGADLAESLRRRDVDQCSFAFTVRKGGAKQTITREGGVEDVFVELTDVDLYDVSIVVYPAYEAATVEAVKRDRLQARKAAHVAWIEGRRAALAELPSNLETVS